MKFVIRFGAGIGLCRPLDQQTTQLDMHILRADGKHSSQRGWRQAASVISALGAVYWSIPRNVLRYPPYAGKPAVQFHIGT